MYFHLVTHPYWLAHIPLELASNLRNPSQQVCPYREKVFPQQHVACNPSQMLKMLTGTWEAGFYCPKTVVPKRNKCPPIFPGLRWYSPLVRERLQRVLGYLYNMTSGRKWLLWPTDIFTSGLCDNSTYHCKWIIGNSDIETLKFLKKNHSAKLKSMMKPKQSAKC